MLAVLIVFAVIVAVALAVVIWGAYFLGDSDNYR
jgi:hypothetical protein